MKTNDNISFLQIVWEYFRCFYYVLSMFSIADPTTLRVVIIIDTLYSSFSITWKNEYTTQKLYPGRWSFLLSMCFNRTVFRLSSMSYYSKHIFESGYPSFSFKSLMHVLVRYLWPNGFSTLLSTNDWADSNTFHSWGLKESGSSVNGL